MYLAVVWAIVYRMTVRVDLVKLTWEESRSVKARVESTVLVIRTATHLDARKNIVPACLSLLLNLSKSLISHLLEVQPSLLKRDE